MLTLSLFQRVDDFHVKFGVDAIYPEAPALYPIAEVEQFRVKFIDEEVNEGKAALERRDLAKYVDAQLDTIYVAAGNLLLLGLSPQACEDLLNEVHRANMRKVRASRASESTRGTAFDVVKPADFVPPDIEGVLRQHGWNS